MSLLESERREQQATNLSALPYFDAFAEHRARLTSLLMPKDFSQDKSRLCVLGAGNCYDLDLPRLAQAYSEVHLVDLDEQALDRAYERLDETTRQRIVRHAPIDLSGLLDRLARWAEFRVTEQELLEHPKVLSASLTKSLGGPFDVVLSSCIFTQMQLFVVNVLSDQHRLFEAVRVTLTVSHMRTLAKLVAPGGRAFFVTDTSSDLIAPLKALPAGTDFHELVKQLTESGAIFQVTDFRLITEVAKDDPELQRTVRVSGVSDAWLWQNGPERLLLVYALELSRLA